MKLAKACTHRRAPTCSLLAAHLPELGRQRVDVLFEVLARLLAEGLRLFLVAEGEIRLEHGPPAVVELRPFLAAEHGAGLGDVAVADEGMEALGIAPKNGAKEVVDPLQDDSVVAGEVLDRQVGRLAAEGIEEHGGAEGSIR